jgi:hypothetical protein
MATEKNIQNASLLAIGSDPDVLAMRLQSGIFRSMDDPSRIVKVGTPGVSDSVAIVKVTVTPDMVGKSLAVIAAAEFKTQKGKQREAQVKWQEAFEKRGGRYRLIRSPQQMKEFIDEVKTKPYGD